MRGYPGDGAIYVDDDGGEHKAVLLSPADNETAVLAYSEGNTFEADDRRIVYHVPHTGDVDRSVRCYKLRRTADWVPKLIEDEQL